MHTLPLTDPGTPDLRSPVRFLLRMARLQASTLSVGMTFGIIWMTGQALVPYLLGKAIAEGVAGNDESALLRWAGLLFGVGAVQAVAGIVRHRFAVTNWLIAAYRLEQWIARQAVRLGSSLPQRVPTGEVVAIGATDIMQVGSAMDVSQRAAGSIVSFIVVAVILLHTSVTLGLVVLIGVPVLTLSIGPIIKPLQQRQADQRHRVGELTTLGSDTVSGLRVLRGIGGEDEFVARYAAESERVRVSGVQVARVQSVLDAVQVLLPGIFVVTATWLGVRFALSGSIGIGDLVAFYGYAAFLVMPLSTATETVEKWTRAVVASRRAVRVLALDPVLVEAFEPEAAPPALQPLYDERSGLTVRPAQLTAVVSAVPEETSELADRLGRYVDDGAVALDGTPLTRLALADVRDRVLVADKDPRLFIGTLRSELDPSGRHDDAALVRALDVASAADVLDAVPDGLSSEVEERGRGFSGGQRQRLVLARALLADPEILVLDEPTSAVDAHTEARIAERLRDARHGRTTVVMTTSPLVLDRVDRVVLLDRGVVVAEGGHGDLMRSDARYRAVVTRGEQL